MEALLLMVKLLNLNAYYNKEIARLASIRMKQLGSEKFNNTKQIR